MAEGSPTPEAGYNLMHFKKGSAVAVEVCKLAYNLTSNPFGSSLQLQGVYHLGEGSIIGHLPRPSQKRNAEYQIGAARKKGGAFRADLVGSNA